MTGRPISHTRSATGIKSNDWTSHQLYKKRHVEGTGRTLISSLSLGIDQAQGQSQCQGKDDAQGDATMRRPRRRLERHKERCQRETSRASPTKISASLLPRYPQVGKTVEGNKVEEGEVSYWRRLPDTHR